MSLNTCISYLNKMFPNFLQLFLYLFSWWHFQIRICHIISIFREHMLTITPKLRKFAESESYSERKCFTFSSPVKDKSKRLEHYIFQPCTKMFKILLHQRTFFYHDNNLLVQIPHLFSDINTWIEFFHMLRMALRLININKKNKGFLNLYHVRVSTLSVC